MQGHSLLCLSALYSSLLMEVIRMVILHLIAATFLVGIATTLLKWANEAAVKAKNQILSDVKSKIKS